MEKILTISLLLLLLPYSPIHAAEPRSASQQFSQANKLFAAARFNDAISLYQNLLNAPPAGVSVSDLHTRIADSWFRLGSYDRALSAYRLALKTQKDSSRAENQYWIAFCCFLMGRDSEALEEFLKIPELYPESGMWVGTAYYWAGRASERMGKAEEASLYYRKAGGNGRSTQGRFALKKAKAAKNDE